MNSKRMVLVFVGIAFLVGGQSPVRAVTTNLYASFNNGNNLDVGSPSTATAAGTVTTVLGMTNTIGGNTFNAVNFDASSSLGYGASSSYADGFTPGGAVQANTFRLLFKPDFSGNPTSFRASFLGLGYLGGYNGIYLGTDEDNGGRPRFFASINNVGEQHTIPAGFSWDANTWYYIAASMDSSGSTLYVRALTNNSTAVISTDTFAGSTWGSGGLDNGTTAFTLRIGGRAGFPGGTGLANESARGSIDEVLILGGTRYGVSDFNADFAVIVPEPSALVLVLGAALAFGRRRR